MLDFLFEEPEDVGVWGNVIDAWEREENTIWRGACGSQDRGQKSNLMSPQEDQNLSARYLEK